MTTPFVFDMTNREALIQSLCSYFGLSEEQVEDFVLMNEDVSLELFCQTYDIVEEQLNRPALYIASYHSTTNMDRCASIQTLGLLNLRETIRQDTPLARYLRERGVMFDLDNKTVCCHGNVFDLRKKHVGVVDSRNRAKDFVAYKLYEDHQINGFLCTDDVLDYGGYVNLRPEFLMNVAELFKDSRLESDWKRDPKRQAYVLKYIAPLSDYNPSTFSIHREVVAQKSPEEVEEMKVQGLLTTALRTLFNSMVWGTVSEDISYLNGDAVVPPQNIIQIYTAESYTTFNETAW
ncbi:hypothetical protein BK120_22980 [Paenibacillus sp. FSL A5-0031]|uniref:hypothetical protein n=1 Tax=Paenibacillus sp. FSL A5-0031 TaxID=1920420 RepID=UPI00096C138D|nr:hypothetical protein [Paenibacillus sp. FSL A5-0031]OME78605.1 hypothetical protein BK120_22980 [Paenibacillus sp. FSL A5-0031]